MRKVFLLDDIRDEVAAYHGAGISISAIKDDSITMARTFEEGVNVILDNDKFDLWILDHDLGCFDSNGSEQSGYDFLRYFVYTYPDKVPGSLLSCSANPIGRERINSLFQNWIDFK